MGRSLVGPRTWWPQDPMRAPRMHTVIFPCYDRPRVQGMFWAHRGIFHLNTRNLLTKLIRSTPQLGSPARVCVSLMPAWKLAVCAVGLWRLCRSIARAPHPRDNPTRCQTEIQHVVGILTRVCVEIKSITLAAQ